MIEKFDRLAVSAVFLVFSESQAITWDEIGIPASRSFFRIYIISLFSILEDSLGVNSGAGKRTEVQACAWHVTHPGLISGTTWSLLGMTPSTAAHVPTSFSILVVLFLKNSLLGTREIVQW